MRVTGMVTMSHSPSWNLQPVEGPAKPYVDAVFRARDHVAALKPDAIVAFGPDHVRNFFFDAMPTFCIGVEKLTAFGDYDSPKGPLPVAREPAVFIAENVVADRFDHGISQPIGALAPDRDMTIYREPGMKAAMANTLVLQNEDVRRRNLVTKEEWRGVNVPIFIVIAPDDNPDYTTTARRIEAIAPDVSAMTIDKVKHWAHFEAPDVFNPANLAFLRDGPVLAASGEK